MSSSENPLSGKDEVDLEFQQFSNNDATLDIINLDEPEEDDLFVGMTIGEEIETEQPKPEKQLSLNFFSYSFYQQFFDVDSSEVLVRIYKTVVPWKPNFFENIKSNPDLYGPFWISTCLIILLAISSNFGDFFNWYRVYKDLHNPIPPTNGTSSTNPWRSPNTKNLENWTNDFSKVIVGSIFIYTYVFILPTILWVFAKWKNISISLIQFISIYGYSCFLFLPSIILMTLNYDYLRWIFIFISFVYSSLFLSLNTGFELKDHLLGREKFLIIGVLLYMIVLQLFFSFFLKLYFFNFSH